MNTQHLVTQMRAARREPHLLLADAEAERGTLEAVVLSTPFDLLDRQPPGDGMSIAATIRESIADRSEL
jgi:hypothetical protein